MTKADKTTEPEVILIVMADSMDVYEETWIYGIYTKLSAIPEEVKQSSWDDDRQYYTTSERRLEGDEYVETGNTYHYMNTLDHLWENPPRIGWYMELAGTYPDRKAVYIGE